MSRFAYDEATGLMVPSRLKPRLGKRLCSLGGIGSAFFAGSAPPVGHDPLWSSVTFYADFDYGSTNNGTAIVDRSTVAHVLSSSGTPKTTTGGLYGTTLSGEFDGAESWWGTSNYGTDLQLPTTGWCIEGTAKTSTTASTKILVTTRGQFSDVNYEVRINQGSAGDISFITWYGGGGTVSNTAGGVIAANTTFDWAVNNPGGGAPWVLYVNGVSVLLMGPRAIQTGNSNFNIGKEDGDSGRSWVGRMYRLRLTQASRYSGNYTPTVWPTSA